MDQIKIGEFLRTLRKEKGLTQEQLADELQVSGRTVSRWETGSNMPDISLLVEIAEFYDVTIPELIDGERKSEKMNEEVKEVADKMADYAGNEKATMIKNIRNHSIFGVVAIVVLFILECLVPNVHNQFTDAIHRYCETLVYVVVIMIFFISTGLLRRFERKPRESNLPKPVLYVITCVAALVLAVVLKYILMLVL